ncbi:hypothetical protein I79_013422 [Cricetulus griseus]|uniref:Uncharacterized protein n=1 Tax=Cricetulus griseus TaxID=10029 RepID=G3HRF5_CRIGR|nr:hypothetical protein I79_013422 [Cricetulus griseus]
MEKVPVLGGEFRGKEEPVVWLPGISRPLETFFERECHNSIFNSHKLKLLLPKSSFKKCKSQGFFQVLRLVRGL